jgi:phosphinothricin acetyltransferase
MQRRWASRRPEHPWILAEEDGRILGYACGSTFNERVAYRWSVSVGVYLAHDILGRGVGPRLYAELFTRLNAIGFHNAFAGITEGNERSVRFHESQGFTKVAHYRNVGFKMGRWHDVSWWQKELRPCTGAPAPLGQ